MSLQWWVLVVVVGYEFLMVHLENDSLCKKAGTFFPPKLCIMFSSYKCNHVLQNKRTVVKSNCNKLSRKNLEG